MWTGRVLSAFAILFMTFDGVIKLIPIDPVVDTFNELGYSPSLALGIGILGLICVALYAIPRTSVLGAILLTGYLGGAVATHVRVGSPLFSHRIFPIYIGLLVWGGLYLRDRGLRRFIPLRNETVRSSIAVIMVMIALSGTASGQETAKSTEGRGTGTSQGNCAAVYGLRMFYEIQRER
jgi:hypothetical protein